MKNHERKLYNCRLIFIAYTCKLEFEPSVGITEYIRDDKIVFTGILKQRYCDFIVNEIDLLGNEVHLTDMSIPDEMVLHICVKFNCFTEISWISAS